MRAKGPEERHGGFKVIYLKGKVKKRGKAGGLYTVIPSPSYCNSWDYTRLNQDLDLGLPQRGRGPSTWSATCACPGGSWELALQAVA